MSRYDRIAMPADTVELARMLRWAYRRGRAMEAHVRGFDPPPRTGESCEEHPAYDGDCIACIEVNAYCPHGHLGLMHPDAPTDAPCWRPRYIDED